MGDVGSQMQPRLCSDEELPVDFNAVDKLTSLRQRGMWREDGGKGSKVRGVAGDTMTTPAKIRL